MTHIAIPGTQRGSPVISSSTLSPCGYVYRRSMFELSYSTHTHTHTHTQTTYSHALSFLWTCYLSFLRGDAIDEEEIKEYHNLEAWLSLSTNDLLNQDADAIDQFFKKIDLDKNGKITITELRSALAQKILIEDLDEGADVERAEIRKSIMNSLMVSTLGT